MGRPNAKQAERMAELGFMLAAEAAEVSGWALSWVHRQIEHGKLEGEKVGGTWYVRRSALAAKLGPTLTAAGRFLTAEEFRAALGREPTAAEARRGPQEPAGGAPAGGEASEATPAPGGPGTAPRGAGEGVPR